MAVITILVNNHDINIKSNDMSNNNNNNNNQACQGRVPGCEWNIISLRMMFAKCWQRCRWRRRLHDNIRILTIMININYNDFNNRHDNDNDTTKNDNNTL